ncbi:MAG TPA: heme o synthase, partial [Gammaproteobacteria bacterium]|nr:heme o synthase [Gammaproteobacteria bacterium]
MPAASWRDFYTLTKPRVVQLLVFTAVVGMFLASPGMVPWNALVLGSLGIALCAASGAAVNHILDQRADATMLRTRRRPLPSGRVTERDALAFALGLGLAGLTILILWVNALTAALTFVSLIGYAVIYTVFLKRATPQNIVIGGAAGAAPPVLGWAAVTGHASGSALLLFLIIFTWTPPHFWALAIARKADYEKAQIPMLPVTHGEELTKSFVLYYTILL